MKSVPIVFFAMMQPISFKSAPSVLVFQINSRSIKVSKSLKYVQDHETVVLDVRGLISTRSSCENEGDFDKFSSRNLLKCKGKTLVLVVYARV
jgi:hypothetical protein